MLGGEAIPVFHNSLHLRRSPRRGRGVFAATDLPVDTVVEVSPLLILPRAEVLGVLCMYVFKFDAKRCAMPLGWGGLFNHSADPSVRHIGVKDNAALARLIGISESADMDHMCPAMVFATQRSVREGEELTIDYSGRGEDLSFSD